MACAEIRVNLTLSFSLIPTGHCRMVLGRGCQALELAGQAAAGQNSGTDKHPSLLRCWGHHRLHTQVRSTFLRHDHFKKFFCFLMQNSIIWGVSAFKFGQKKVF